MTLRNDGSDIRATRTASSKRRGAWFSRRSAMRRGGDRLKTLRLFTDGAARGNPGHAGIGLVIEVDGGAPHEDCKYIGVATNNEAEYHALIEGLKAAQPLNPDRLEVYLDSQLVVEQMNGPYKVRKPELKLLYDQAKKLRGGFSEVVIRHIGREQNGVADALANQAINEHLGITESNATR
jgi:ribonuclease HI